MMALLIQTVWAADVQTEERSIVELAFTVIVPFKDRIDARAGSGHYYN